MAAQEHLKEYLEFKKLEKGQLKDTLSRLLDKADEENAEYVLTHLKTQIDAVASDNDSPKLKLQYAAQYLETIYANFDKDPEKTKTMKEAVAAPEPKAEKKDKVSHQNPFSTKMRARCPSCLKCTDVSKLSLDVQKRIRCPRPTCNAKRAIGNWICTKCSAKETEARKNGKKAQVKIWNCTCYADLLSQQGTMIIKCPDSNCTGWRHNMRSQDRRCPTWNEPSLDRRGPSIRKKCDVCGGITSVLNWNCVKCSNKGKAIEFAKCACGEKLRSPMRKNTKKLMMKKGITLSCPRSKCSGKRTCEEKEFPWLKKVRTVARNASCRKCKKRRSMWEWRCYTCNEPQFNCKCKRPGGQNFTIKCTPQTPGP